MPGALQRAGPSHQPDQALFSLLGTTCGADGRVNSAPPDQLRARPIHRGIGHRMGLTDIRLGQVFADDARRDRSCSSGPVGRENGRMELREAIRTLDELADDGTMYVEGDPAEWSPQTDTAIGVEDVES